MATKRINLNIDEDLLTAVDSYAKQWSTTRTGAICVMLAQFMEQSQAMRVLPTLITANAAAAAVKSEQTES